MSDARLGKPQGGYLNFDQTRNDVSVVAINWFVNRCPLVTRVPRAPVSATMFTMLDRSPEAIPEALPIAIRQYCQTWQHPVQVDDVRNKPGEVAPFDSNKMEALQNLMDNMEYSSYYGRGEDPSVSGRPKQKGLRTLIGQNMLNQPTNSEAYTIEDFHRDMIQKAKDGGGDPDVLIVSTNFMAALDVWNSPAIRINAGQNVFGTPIDVFECRALSGVSIIEAPLLKPYTAICLTSSEVRMRMKRNEFWSPHSSLGIPFIGDYIAEGAIELENPKHHAWVEGITGFAASRKPELKPEVAKAVSGDPVKAKLLAACKAVHAYAVMQAEMGHALPNQMVSDLFNAINAAESEIKS